MTTQLAIRYAKALFHSTEKTGQQDLLSCFEAFISLYNKMPKLYAFLNSPEISREQKESVLRIPFKEKPTFLGFLSLLMHKGRFKYLEAIAKEYHSIFTNTYGMTQAYLTTAVSLDEEMKEHLKEKLNRIYSKQFELICDVDPQIIGGGVLVISDYMIDFSVKNKLDRLKSQLEKC
ncbi:MAG: ATP synthase F1 subunit delta [Parachlamydiaceae bacterium]|nr:ATP synthase F1 subunit delta [Parachlamydiaceae bacterium]